jgi:hypothetical protein
MTSKRISGGSAERRDFRLGVINGGFFGLAETLTDPALVLVAFVAALGGSPLVVGLAAPIRNAGWYLPQLLISGRMQSAPRKLPFYARLAVVRLAAWGVVALAPLLLGRFSPSAVLAVFLIAFLVAESAAGLAGCPSWRWYRRSSRPHGEQSSSDGG